MVQVASVALPVDVRITDDDKQILSGIIIVAAEGSLTIRRRDFPVSSLALLSAAIEVPTRALESVPNTTFVALERVSSARRPLATHPLLLK